MKRMRRNVLKFMWASVALFVGTFFLLWATWALFPALALVGLMLVGWVLGALFATAIIPGEDYLRYSEAYRQAVEDNENDEN